jgi:hypothetical protein
MQGSQVYNYQKKVDLSTNCKTEAHQGVCTSVTLLESKSWAE